MGLRAKLNFRTALGILHASRIPALIAPWTRGQGAIFTLHSVTPDAVRAFEPNRILKVTPEFLETAIVTVRKLGYDIVSLDEAIARTQSGHPRPFACFTLDDGYRDNRDHAYPVFKKHNVPFTIYVPADYPDGKGDLWWYVLENAIDKLDRVRFEIDGKVEVFDAATPEAKTRAFYAVYWPLRARPENELRAGVHAIARQAGYDPSSLCRDLIMTWDEIRELAKDPLVTIGAHTCRHLAVAKLSEDDARREIVDSIARIEKELGRPCPHFSFPYGDPCSADVRDFAIARALGVTSGVTTRKNVIRASADVCGLPRISLNGDYQEARFVEVMMTGVPFLLFDAVKAMIRLGKRILGAGRGVAQPEPAAIRRPGAASI